MSLPNAQPYARPGNLGPLAAAGGEGPCPSGAPRAPDCDAGTIACGVAAHRRRPPVRNLQGRARSASQIDLILPVDLVGDLSRPLDIEFLDGGETGNGGNSRQGHPVEFSAAEINA